jgi:hypothetical protein
LITGADITTVSSVKASNGTAFKAVQHGQPSNRDFLAVLMQGGDVIVVRARCRYSDNRARGERPVKAIVGHLNSILFCVSQIFHHEILLFVR